MGQSSFYRNYLTTDGWRARRIVALEFAHYRCQLCNSDKNLEVHHRCYDKLGREPLSDLVVLCAQCHRRHHRALEEKAEKPGLVSQMFIPFEEFIRPLKATTS